MRATLVLMAKEPRAGCVKTRLAKHVGDSLATRLYAAFLSDLVARFGTEPEYRRALAVWPPDVAAPWLDPFRDRYGVLPQRGPDLAARMAAVIDDLLPEGPVLLLGTDVPTVPIGHVRRAFAALASGADAVLGPDRDGGYYAIGLSRPLPGLFDVTLSTDRVLDDTVARLVGAGASFELLPVLGDVDDQRDLERLIEQLRDPAIAALAPLTAALIAELFPG